MSAKRKTEPYEPCNIMQKYPYIKSEKIHQSAKGEVCTMGSPVCNYNAETTVWCHSNMDIHGACYGKKASSIFGFYGCYDCHMWYDGQAHMNVLEDKDWYFWRAFTKSLNRLIEKGLVSIK